LKKEDPELELIARGFKKSNKLIILLTAGWLSHAITKVSDPKKYDSADGALLGLIKVYRKMYVVRPTPPS
jgi:hypothetical protein